MSINPEEPLLPSQDVEIPHEAAVDREALYFSIQDMLEGLAHNNPGAHYERFFGIHLHDETAKNEVWEFAVRDQPTYTSRGSVAGRKKGFSVIDPSTGMMSSNWDAQNKSYFMFVQNPKHITGITVDKQEEFDKDLPGVGTAIQAIRDKLDITDERPRAISFPHEEHQEIWGKLWEDAGKAGSPTIFDVSEKLILPTGKEVHVSAHSDMQNLDGGFLPDEQKPVQYINIRTGGFTYSRMIEGGNIVEESYEEPIPDDLPPLTEDERKGHRYCVIPSSMARPMFENAVSEDEGVYEAKPAGDFAVIAAGVNGPLTITFKTYHKTSEEAQAWADKMYQEDLYRERMSSEVTNERLRIVHDTLRAAIEERARIGTEVDRLEQQF